MRAVQNNGKESELKKRILKITVELQWRGIA